MEKGKTSAKKTKTSPHATLYVSMQNSKEKRKALLYSIKNALVLQEEFEKIMQVRARKKKVLDEIKKSMNSINSKYQEVKKVMPNVKNVISTTEKEFLELNRQVGMLNSQIESDKTRISEDNSMIRAIKGKNTSESESTSKQKKKDPKEMTKMERIQHNLNLINSRLNKL